MSTDTRRVYVRMMKLDIPAQKLIERGYCCGIGCYMCPYDPPHLKKNNRLRDPGKTVRKGSYSKSSMTSHWDWDYMPSEEIDRLFLKARSSDNE